MQSENQAPVSVPDGPESTGMSALDAIIGGLHPGVHLLIAEPCDAQELFLMHVANAGIPTQYLTTDRAPGELESTWEAYGHDAKGVAIQPVDERPIGTVDRRLVFDSLSAYAQEVGWRGCLQTTRQIRAYLQGSPHAAVLQVMPSMHTPAELTRLQALADAVFRIHIDTQGSIDKTQLRIEKIRALRGARRHLPLTVQSTGLRVETVNRVF